MCMMLFTFFEQTFDGLFIMYFPDSFFIYDVNDLGLIAMLFRMLDDRQ